MSKRKKCGKCGTTVQEYFSPSQGSRCRECRKEPKKVTTDLPTNMLLSAKWT